MIRNFSKILSVVLLILVAQVSFGGEVLKVVTTLPDYADFVRRIGGDKVVVQNIVQGNQDAHFIRPKPSFVTMLRKADILVATGLDLEMWLPVAVDKSGNKNIRSGEKGYVAVAAGLKLKEKPAVMSRIEGGLHIYGNPHITVCPLNMFQVMDNIRVGLSRNMPAEKAFFALNCKKLQQQLQEKLYGKELIKLLGGDTLLKMHLSGNLFSFLEENKYKGQALTTYLGGWTKQLYPLKGVPVVTYHKNWKYFFDTFGLLEGGFIEPKPGIPPSPRHVESLKRKMKKENIKLIIAANYFDEKTTMQVARSVGASAIMVPYYVGSTADTQSYFELVDYWVKCLVEAHGKLS